MLRIFLSGIKQLLRTGAWAAALWFCLAIGDQPFPVAGAYVMEGPQVLDLMVKHLAGAKTLQVQQNVEIQDPAVAQQPVELKETLNYIFPDRFRSDAWYQGTNRIFVTSFGKYLTVIDDRVTSYKEGRFDRYKDPLLYQTRFTILKALLASGIDVGTTSLGKTEETTAFVIGAQYPDTSVSQLWVDKERFLPIRLIFAEKGAGDEVQHLEFVYRNWQAFGKVWYPMLIETYHNDVLIRRNQVRTVKVDGDFSPQLLNITYLMSIYSTTGQDQSRQAPPKTDDVQRTIDDFSKKFDP